MLGKNDTDKTKNNYLNIKGYTFIFKETSYLLRIFRVTIPKSI